MEPTKEILDKVEAMQKEMHNFIEQVKKKGSLKEGIQYSDISTIYILMKLAELDEKINNVYAKIRNSHDKY